MQPLRQVKLLWISLAILFIGVLLIGMRIEIRLDGMQIQLDRMERKVR